MLRRFPLDTLVVLVVLTALVLTRAWPWANDLQHLGTSATRQDVVQHEEVTTGSTLPLDGEGVRPAGEKHGWTASTMRRSLAANGEQGGQGDAGGPVRWHLQGHPSIKRETKKPTDRVELSSKRSYLNGLVEATAAGTKNQVANIAFVKTHKTASTTLAAIMYRYAVRHNLKLSHFGHTTTARLEAAAAQTKTNRQLVDIMHYHITANGHYKGSWSNAVKYYRRIMRHPDQINFVTALREPRSHLLSYYYYYIQPRNQLSIEEFLMNPADPNDKDHKLLFNPLSAEFGVRTAEGMDTLIKHTLPDFKLIMLTERLDEGLLVLRRMLHWRMIDVTYCDLNETKAGARRWDGKPFVDRPHFDSLPQKVQQKIDDLTDLDRLLYTAGEKEFEKRLAPYANSMNEDNVEFQELQTVVGEYLEGNSSSMAYPMYRSMNVYKEKPENYPF